MPLSVLERIALEIERRLRLLIGGANGVDVSEVIRPRRIDTLTPQDMQVVVSQGNSERVEELSYPGNPPAIAYRQTFNIRCHVMTDEKSEEAIDTTLNEFRADVIAIICTPQASWYQFDGVAVDAQFGTEEQFAGDGGIEGFNLPLMVVYRTDEHDPYTMRA